MNKSMRLPVHIFFVLCIGAMQAWSTPTITFTNDAPIGDHSFVKAYNATDAIPGLITLTVIDDTGTFTTIGASSAPGSNSPIFALEFQKNTAIANGNETASNRLQWGVNIDNLVNTTGDTWTMTLTPGFSNHGYKLHFALLEGNTGVTKHLSTQFAYIDTSAPDAPVMTSPTVASAQSNFVGRGNYSLTASGNYSDESSEFQVDVGLSLAVTDTYRVDFQGSDDNADWISPTAVAQDTISSGTASTTGDFSNSANRKGYIRAVAFDAAGNSAEGTASGNLLETKWMTLGRFGDTGSALNGNAAYAHGWSSSDSVTAGTAVDTEFYATDFYGTRDTTYNVAGNVLDASASSGVASTGYDGTTPDLTISSNTDFLTAGGTGVVSYDDEYTFYKQESAVRLGVQSDGSSTLWPVDSTPFDVIHAVINDVVFTTSDNIQDSGNGVNATAATPGNQTAGTAFNVDFAIIDAYQNICKTANFGSTGTVTLAAGSAAPASAPANGYTPFGGSALSYTNSYDSAQTWNVDATTGVGSASVTLYNAESNINLSLSVGGGTTNVTSNDNTQAFDVALASGRMVFFDDDNTATSFGTVAGSVGTNLNLYTHICDVYGNIDTADTSVISITSYSSSNPVLAYRNDASVVTDAGSTAVAGSVNFTGLRSDKAATTALNSGNSLLYPYSAMALVASFSGNITPSTSQGIEISRGANSNVYFATSAGEPTLASKTISNLAAGDTISVYGVIADTYGNADTSAGNTLSVDISSLNAAPDASVATVSPTTKVISSGLGGLFTVTPVKLETGRTIAIDDNGGTMTAETSSSFDVTYGAMTQIGFIPALGNIWLNPASNTLVGNQTAGTSFTSYVAALDAYKNTYAGSLAGTVTLSGDTNVATSPSANAAVFSSNSFSSGETAIDTTLYDARDGLSLLATYSETLGSGNTAPSENIDVANSTATQWSFRTAAGQDNDNLDSSATGAMTSISALTAGGSNTWFVGTLDAYGNIAENDAASSATLTNHASSGPSTSPSGNAAAYSAAATVTAGQVSLTSIFYTSETSRMVTVSGSSLTAADSASFDVGPAALSQSAFTTSTGAYIQSSAFAESTASPSGSNASSPIPGGGSGSPLDGIYLGFYDDFGNNILSPSVSAGNVSLAMVNGSNLTYTVSGNSIGENSNMGLANTPLDISGSVNSQGVIYFDPSVSSLKTIITIATSGANVMLKTEMDVLSSGSNNSNSFLLGDQVPPNISLLAPNGGETWYPGTWTVSWTATDNQTLSSSSNVEIYLSEDAGSTWTYVDVVTDVGSTSSYAYTITSATQTSQARIRLIMEDDAGNQATDESDANFDIISSAAVISNVIGDVGSASVMVHFREPVYSDVGTALSSSSEFSGNTSVASVAHTAGSTEATLTLSSVLIDADVNQSTVGATSGQLSKNIDGTSPYTLSTVIATKAIRQMGSDKMGVVYTTANSAQKLLGLRVVGWASNEKLKKVNVTISQISGDVTTADFASGSTDSSISGIGLYDAEGNALTLDSAPAMVIGSAFDINYTSVTIGTAAISSGNYNLYIGVKTSSTISDAVPDAFKVTVNSVTVTDASGSGNIDREYVLVGDTSTDPIVVDVTAPAAPAITYTSPVIISSSNASSLTVVGEAGAVATYSFVSGGTVSGNVTIGSDGSGDLSNIDLSGLSEGTATVSVYLTDTRGNSGASNFTTSETVLLDYTAPAAATVSLSTANGANASSYSFAMANAEGGAAYSVTLTDGSSGTVVVTGSVPGSASSTQFNITGINLSGLSDASSSLAVTGSLTDGANNTAAITGGNLYFDQTAPQVPTLSFTQTKASGANSSTFAAALTSGSASTATGSITLTDGQGATLVQAFNGSALVQNFSLNLGTLAEGSLSVVVSQSDAALNSSATSSYTIVKDTVNPDAPVLQSPVDQAAANTQAVFNWTPVNDASWYVVQVTSTADSSFASPIFYSTISSNSVTYTTSFGDGMYHWKVRSIDDFGNVGSYSSVSDFTVNVPVLLYAVGDLNSNSIKAVFNEGVFSSAGATGALSSVSIESSSTFGVNELSHIAGTSEASLTMASVLTSATSGASAINIAQLTPSTNLIYNNAGTIVTSAAVTVRQFAGADVTGSEKVIHYGDSSTNLLGLKLVGWDGATVVLNSIDFRVNVGMGEFSDSDFASAGNRISLSTSLGASIIQTTVGSDTSDFVGNLHTLTLTTGITLSTDPVSAANYTLTVLPASLGSADVSAKTFNLSVESINLSVDGVQKVRILAGDTQSSSLLLTNLSLSSSSGALEAGTNITLSAAGGSSSATFAWSQTAGPTVQLSGSDTVSAVFTPSEADDYRFKLMYTLDGVSVSKWIGVSVSAPVPTEAPSAALIAALSSVTSATSIADSEALAAAVATLDNFAKSARTGVRNNNLVSAISQVVENAAGLEWTEAQSGQIIGALDAAIVTYSTGALGTSAVATALSTLQKMDEVSTTLSESNVKKMFKILSHLGSQVTLSESNLQATIDELTKSAIKSLLASGSSELKIDKPGVKVAIKALENSSDFVSIDSGDGTALGSITISRAVRELLGVGSGMTAFAKISKVERTAASGQVSEIVDYKVFQTDGSSTSTVAVGGLNTPLELNLKIGTTNLGKSYVVKYWTGSVWSTAGISGIEVSADGGSVTCSSTHLTPFTVFEGSDTAAPANGSGGGCFLK